MIIKTIDPNDQIKRDIKKRILFLKSVVKTDSLHVAWLQSVSKKMDNIIKKNDGDGVTQTKDIEKFLQILNEDFPTSRKRTQKGSLEASMERLVKSYISLSANCAFDKEDYAIDLVEVYLSDAADFLKIGVYLKEKNINKAFETVYNLDTLPRDMVPVKVYKYLLKNRTNR